MFSLVNTKDKSHKGTQTTIFFFDQEHKKQIKKRTAKYIVEQEGRKEGRKAKEEEIFKPFSEVVERERFRVSK